MKLIEETGFFRKIPPFLVHFGGAWYFPAMNRNDESTFPVLALKDVMLREEWEGGGRDPLNLEVWKESIHTLPLTRKGEAIALIRVIKGISVPARGRIFKRGRDATGWIQPDGIVALHETGRFFFPTVRDEIAFALRVGRAKKIPGVPSFQETVLKSVRFDERKTCSPVRLARVDQELLALTAALLMAPDLLILLCPLENGDEPFRVRYSRLLEIARQRLGMALLKLSFRASPLFAAHGSHRFQSAVLAGDC